MVKRAAFVERFVLPLVRGGEVHVGAPLGFAGHARLSEERDDSAAERHLATHRWTVAALLLPHAAPPTLDDDALRMAIALHDLLFLSHPDAPDPAHLERRRRIANGCLGLLEPLAEIADREALVARHTLLIQLPALHRIDVRLSFWAGRREFHGRVPPARLSAWPRLRRVSEERTRVGCLAEAAGDVTGGSDVIRVLLRKSPITDLCDPLRREPPFDLRGFEGLAGALADPDICRLVAYRWLEDGIDHTGAAFAAALVQRLGAREPADLQFALALCAHLHLCLVLGGPRVRTEAVRAAERGEAPLRDFYGLYAALFDTAPSRAAPADVRADPILAPLVAEHAAACRVACGSARTRELCGLIARTLDVSENVAA